MLISRDSRPCSEASDDDINHRVEYVSMYSVRYSVRYSVLTRKMLYHDGSIAPINNTMNMNMTLSLVEYSKVANRNSEWPRTPADGWRCPRSYYFADNVLNQIINVTLPALPVLFPFYLFIFLSFYLLIIFKFLFDFFTFA